MSKLAGLAVIVAVLSACPPPADDRLAYDCTHSDPAILRCWSGGELIVEQEIRVAGGWWLSRDRKTRIRQEGLKCLVSQSIPPRDPSDRYTPEKGYTP